MHPSVAVLAAILVSCHAFVQDGYDLDQPIQIEEYGTKAGGQLVGMLDKVREVLRKGNETLGIPVLDPFYKKEWDLNVDKEGLAKVAAQLSNVRGYGLSTYKVEQGDFSIIGLNVNVTLSWESIALMTNYKLSGTVSDSISIYGDGKIAAALSDLVVHVDMNLSLRDKRLFVSKLSMGIHLKKIDFQITGLYNDDSMSKLMSKVVTENLPQIIEDYQQQLTKSASPLVIKTLNNILKNFTLKDILGMLG